MDASIKKIIEEGHLGVRTYEKFVDACLDRCASGDEDTVSLFVLAKIVQPFWEYYRDDALTEDEARGFRQRLLGHISAVEAAGGAEDRLRVLQEIIWKELNASAK